MNPDNPVIRLCVQGMEAEAAGRGADAGELFRRAWDTAEDDYEACVAAHYLARHQLTPQDKLRWNQESLDRADLVGDERVRGFYASLHINMGQALQGLGEPAAAYAHFRQAAEHIEDVPAGDYGNWNRCAIAEGLRATRQTAVDEPSTAALRAVDALLAELLAGWCARADLKALAMALPAYLGCLGTDADRARLRAALHMVHAAGWLPEAEQRMLGEVIGSPAFG
ncbi:hypothetical protein [Streptomyces sp. MST-110588]|uniref:hypothetical protein n=1 Tax=Streptomyces sp. MST-110588 TaxID=2833628 RepID=UPI001F5D79F9|nr:hypothetical protein [Streptomyces sp. MST-110588]UNO40926.1 hypothetical protein KGS77_16760 [Streptomyces sp. MST-110588]